jgi:putative FmdB family regulatory protein
MPLYDFYCEKCGNEEEILLKKYITNEHKQICKCGNEMKKDIGYFSVFHQSSDLLKKGIMDTLVWYGDSSYNKRKRAELKKHE